MDYRREQATAKKNFGHDDRKRGSIVDRDQTVWRSVSAANCKDVIAPDAKDPGAFVKKTNQR